MRLMRITTRDAFQPDNLHPTAQAQPALLNYIRGGLKPLSRP